MARNFSWSSFQTPDRGRHLALPSLVSWNLSLFVLTPCLPRQHNPSRTEKQKKTHRLRLRTKNCYGHWSKSRNTHTHTPTINGTYTHTHTHERKKAPEEDEKKKKQVQGCNWAIKVCKLQPASIGHRPYLIFIFFLSLKATLTGQRTWNIFTAVKDDRLLLPFNSVYICSGLVCVCLFISPAVGAGRWIFVKCVSVTHALLLFLFLFFFQHRQEHDAQLILL